MLFTNVVGCVEIGGGGMERTMAHQTTGESVLASVSSPVFLGLQHSRAVVCLCTQRLARKRAGRIPGSALPISVLENLMYECRCVVAARCGARKHARTGPRLTNVRTCALLAGWKAEVTASSC